MPKEKQTPKVISFKKYQDDTVVLAKRIDALALTLKEKNEFISKANQTIVFERETNDKIRLEHQEVLRQVIELKDTLLSLQIDLKAKLELIETLHDQLGTVKHNNVLQKDLINSLTKQVESFKKRKWYHFIFSSD